MVNHWFRNRQGNIAVPGAVVAVVLMTLAGGGMDMMMVSNQKSALQNLADNAALSAVREMAIVSEDAVHISAIATAYVEHDRNAAITKTTPLVNMEERTVTVSLEAKPKTSFPGPMSEMKLITVSATAKLSGQGGNICMIGLSPTAVSTLRMRSMAKITAEACGIYSNSTSKFSMSVANTAEVESNLICVAGGYLGDSDDMKYKPVEDCPQIDDPLSQRPLPEIGSCDYHDTIIARKKTLDPGVYCGGLEVNGGSARLNDGVYIIQGGSLIVTNNGTLKGDHVGFYLADERAKIGFDYDANIDIAAPKDGVMAGMLIMSHPHQDTIDNGATKDLAVVDTLNATTRMGDGIAPSDHTIRSDNARRLVGTIYLPNGKLLINGRNPIADRSEYTVIIADTFELQEGPNLVLQSDYHLSDVPVPEGVGPTQDIAPVLVR